MFKAPFSFNGRIRRLEYGLSLLLYIGLYLPIYYFLAFPSDPEAGASPLLSIVFLLIIIPLIWFLLAQSAKRCHDRGNSGWWQIIPFYSLILLFGDGESGANRFGLNPKGIGNESELQDFAEILHPENKVD